MHKKRPFVQKMKKLRLAMLQCQQMKNRPHGLRRQAGAGDHLGLNASLPATCFPTAATVANSWDEELGEEIGAALAEEAATMDVNVILGPGLNIKRSPLCGRNFEYFSEDPYHAGKMAAAYVRGMQSKGGAACPKHFAVNSQELRRMANFGIFMFTNSSVDFGYSYMVYGEGIYVGYNYYETRYEDVVLGNEDAANYDYTASVQYPFGYGLSYTDFEWSNYKVADKGDNYEVSVDVKNTGSVAGKDIVQIYMQSPYTEYDKEQGMDQAGNADQTSKVTVNEIDAKTYASSQATGNEITNQFEDVDIKKYDDSYQYLSRSDWTGTWPETYNGGTWEAPDALLSDLELHTDESSNSAEPVTGTVDETEGKLSAASLIGLDYDDELWMKLVQQMSQDEVDELVRIGGYATKSVKSIQLPETVDKDGPAGISGTLVGGESGTSYPPEVVLASTWNDDLSEEFGKCIGEDSLALGVQVWYAPACNIHRSPYSGRNFEYYSEDSFLSGKMAATTSAGAQSKGAVVTVKHFALNDQETNRMGCAIFANEQSVRQVYLAAFETAVR